MQEYPSESEKKSIFSDLTTEEAEAISGGLFGINFKRAFQAVGDWWTDKVEDIALKIVHDPWNAIFHAGMRDEAPEPDED